MARDLQDLLHDYPLIDGHNDLPWAARELAGYDFDRLDLRAGTDGRTHTDLPRLRAGLVGGQFWSVWVPATLPGHAAVTATLEQIDGVHLMIERYPDRLGLARTAAQAREVFASGRIASFLGAEGGHSIGCSLGALRMMYALGVRYLTLTHNENVPWADSATDEPVHHGHSIFGVQVVNEMNRLGMLVDLSHVSADTMRDALAASVAPVIFSHSSARAVCDSPRNAPDDVLETLRARDGIIMATFVPDFVAPDCAAWRAEAREIARAQGIDPNDHEAYEAFAARREQSHPRPSATIDHVLAHFDHLREVIGVDHIGVGGDYDGVGELPVGLADVSSYPRLFGALRERGWSDQDLIKVAGANVLRVLGAAEDVARDLQATRGPGLATYRGLDG